MAPWPCLLWLPLLLLAASGHAGAEVFEATPGRGEAGLFGGLRAELELGARRVAFWNGVRVELQQGRTRRRPAELFDRVERRASPEGAEAGASGDESDFAAGLRRRIERGHRRDGTGWSVLVRLPDRARDVASLVEARAPRATGDGPDRDGFIAVAIWDPGARRSDVLVTHLARESPLLELFGLATADVSGQDIEGLPRYPGSQRALAFSEPQGASAVHQVAYEGRGSVADHVRHYRRALSEAGLREAPSVPARRAASGPAEPAGVHLRFAGPDREVSVHVQPHPDGRRTLDLIQLRFQRNPS